MHRAGERAVSQISRASARRRHPRTQGIYADSLGQPSDAGDCIARRATALRVTAQRDGEKWRCCARQRNRTPLAHRGRKPRPNVEARRATAALTSARRATTPARAKAPAARRGRRPRSHCGETCNGRADLSTASRGSAQAQTLTAHHGRSPHPTLSETCNSRADRSTASHVHRNPRHNPDLEAGFEPAPCRCKPAAHR